LKLERERIEIEKLVKKKRNLYFQASHKVICMIKPEMFKIYQGVTQSFWWRNFSKYVPQRYS
jgi:hypothetical protein